MKEEREARMAHEQELMQMRLEYQQRVTAPPVHTRAPSSPAFPSRPSSGEFNSDMSLDFDLGGYGVDANYNNFEIM